MAREIEETFGRHLLRIEEAQDRYLEASTQNEFPGGGVIFGSDVAVPLLRDGDDDKISKMTIGYPVHLKNMFYIVDVPAGAAIDAHRHDEDIFRILISGDITVNNRDVAIGEWFVVPAGTTYEIHTRQGYKALSAYTSICQTRRVSSNLHFEEDWPE
ncbi:hypothetical protein [Henriciella sp.]|uniref:hypothetical protein n=1 Tax=Henriciella TaxID=453849 RepID=UPI003518C820